MASSNVVGTLLLTASLRIISSVNVEAAPWALWEPT